MAVNTQVSDFRKALRRLEKICDDVTNQFAAGHTVIRKSDFEELLDAGTAIVSAGEAVVGPEEDETIAVVEEKKPVAKKTVRKACVRKTAAKKEESSVAKTAEKKPAPKKTTVKKATAVKKTTVAKKTPAKKVAKK